MCLYGVATIAYVERVGHEITTRKFRPARLREIQLFPVSEKGRQSYSVIILHSFYYIEHSPTIIYCIEQFQSF
jgi:hypothetical protein